MPKTRNEVEDLVVNSMMGPLFGDGEVLDFDPLNLYVTGLLYPRTEIVNTGDESDPEIEKEGAEDLSKRKKGKSKEQDDNNSVESELLSTSFFPASMALSFCLNKNSAFNIKINYSRYDKTENEGKSDSWKSKDFSLKEIPVKLSDDGLFVDGEQVNDFKSKTLVDESEKSIIFTIRSRSIQINDIQTFVITVSIVNGTLADKSKGLKNSEECIFRPRIKCVSVSDAFIPFNDFSELEKLSDPEIINEKLLYAHYQKFASGHGVSATWESVNESGARSRRWVSTEVIPTYEVLPNDFNHEELLKNDIDDILHIKPLAGKSFSNDGLSESDLISRLTRFIDVYEEWVKRLTIDLVARVSSTGYSEKGKTKIKVKGKENIQKCHLQVQRMRKALDIFKTAEDNPIHKHALRAFYDANRVMFMQRAIDWNIKRRRKDHGDHIWPTPEIDEALPNFSDFPARNEPSGEQFFAKWRPFQLAFLLTQVTGMIDPNSEDRETVDLIWFSTGGGKTEAYLGLIAMNLFYRRLREGYKTGNPDNGAGVSAVMRYTLRLLIKQQYDRAVPVILACELIRRNNNETYGSVPYSIGIWVGKSLTPNKAIDKNEKSKSFAHCLESLKSNPETEVYYSLPVLDCPACGTSMIKKKKKDLGKWGCIPSSVNDRGQEKPPYHLVCTNGKCDFHVPEEIARRGEVNEITKRGLPIYFIDEDIYLRRPSLVFSTIDKYASLNWNKECYRTFNIELNDDGLKRSFPPPDLIIQDELHLISSTLGTIYGLYEIAIDQLCSIDGRKPKIVAATATVKDAESQCRLLYGRKRYSQFPSPGISADDSFFSRKMSFDNDMAKDRSPQGRLYIGLQASGFTNTVTQIRLVASLLQLTPRLNISNQDLDPYVTNLIYFNTKKELGKFRTLLTDDIQAQANILSKPNISKPFGSYSKGYRQESFYELSSDRTGDEITDYLSRLEKTELKKEIGHPLYSLGIRSWNDLVDNNLWKEQFKEKFNNSKLFDALQIEGFKKDESEEAIDLNRKLFASQVKNWFDNQDNEYVPSIVAATIMISVGIDIERFNVMQMTGQPKSHSEYIQASSRAGRLHKGIIVTTFNPAKNRDRSHYEEFTDYHQGFYRYVEATSVTPFSKPALSKALFAPIMAIIQAEFSGTSDDVPWSEGLARKIDSIEQMVLSRINAASENFSGISKLDLKFWSENIKSEFNVIRDNWRMHSSINDRAYIPEYGKFYNKFNDARLAATIAVRLDESIYVNSELKEMDSSLENKLSCMTNMRSVELSVPVKLISRT
jgi:hypothetical protein